VVLPLSHATAESASQANTRVLTQINSMLTKTASWGSQRIWEDLRYAGERCGRHRVARLMRRAGLQESATATAVANEAYGDVLQARRII